MNDNQRISAAMERLFRTYPSQAKGANEFEVARNRVAAAEVYMRAVAPYTAADIEQAVDEFLTGAVPGHNAAFAPTAPQVGAVCRRVMERRLDTENRMRRLRPALPAPDIIHTPEQQARAKAQVEAFIASQGPTQLDQRVIDQASRDRMAAHDSFFADQFVPTEGGVGRISKTLAKKLGYDIGSPEADENAA